MADKKISDLTVQTSVDSGDLFVTAQEDASNKYITGAALKTNVLLGNAATATTAGTVTTAAQGAITSVGTLTGLTMGGTVACADNIVSRARLDDYGETVNALGTKTAAFDIDLEDGNVHTLTLSGGGTFNIGIVNALASHSSSLTILGTNLGAATGTFLAGANGGGGTATKWAGGAKTTAAMTASGTDIITFTTFDGGSTWYGFIAGLAMA